MFCSYHPDTKCDLKLFEVSHCDTEIGVFGLTEKQMKGQMDTVIICLMGPKSGDGKVQVLIRRLEYHYII